jgi:hypothetical protein
VGSRDRAQFFSLLDAALASRMVRFCFLGFLSLEFVLERERERERERAKKGKKKRERELKKTQKTTK